MTTTLGRSGPRRPGRERRRHRRGVPHPGPQDARARGGAGVAGYQARDEGWDYQEFLAEEQAARELHGGENRIRAARFPQIKSLDDFDFSHQRSVSRQEIAHLAQLDFLREAHNVIFLGPPGTGKTHLSIALGVQAARRGYRVAFATATDWVLRLSDARRAGRLTDELERLDRIPLLVVDEVGYIPFDPEAASLFFALVSSRYERSSLIVSSNKTFSAWAEIFGDAVAVEAMVDRLIHHSHIHVLKGDSYRLRGKREEIITTESS